jgi:hypothetical protein
MLTSPHIDVHTYFATGKKIICFFVTDIVRAILTYPLTLIAYLLKCVKKRQIALDFPSL